MGNFRQLWLLSLLTQRDQFCTLSVAIKNEQLPFECFLVHFCRLFIFFIFLKLHRQRIYLELIIAYGPPLGVSRDYNSDLLVGILLLQPFTPHLPAVLISDR